MSDLYANEEVLALADEIASLARCGAPLEEGLASLSKEMPGRVRKMLDRLGGELRSGRELLEAVRQSPDFPPIFHAVVEAGVRTGRLPTALEKLSHAMRSALELRRDLRISLTYPVLVVAVAYACFLLSVFYVLPSVQSHRADLYLQPLEAGIAGQLRAVLGVWGWVPPVIGLGVVGWVWWRGTFQWLGGPLARMRRATQVAIFSEILALLVEHDQPLDEAVVLAAKSSGRGRLLIEAEAVAAQLRSGAEPQMERRRSAIPPMVIWILTDGSNPSRMEASLRRASYSYRRRAEALHHWCRVYMPLTLTAVVGGAATLLYCLSVVLPWSGLLHDLIEFAA